ncbi:potassium-transporting ATPase subunit KdpC [Bordetella petrii]|uniref:potassium-transporting ATPase subunit KdpC n=1 Tax=Bordetella petrii TaxID=94624 RepID=UPI001E4E841F|nr:potassium-transporting ATPase subunit KdpC [Bordetella petrii]MCD0503144.1 potassium-transporting ATPase subunit KdpC [Bordetella petrii]
MSTETLLNTAPGQSSVHDRSLLRGAVAMAVLAMLGAGLLYPLAGLGIGQALFPAAANGSLVERDGRVVGSALVAQPFADARYFQPRPSASGYDVMNLAGSNQARSNPEMRQRIEAARDAVARRDQADAEAVPSDSVTQSGGGIDPHISPANAAMQAGRLAAARALARAQVDALVAQFTEGPQFGLLGQPRVNVLRLNLALDRLGAGRTGVQ